NTSTTTDFGSFSTKKAKEFQQYYNLPVTGRINAGTLDKMDEILNSPFQKGKRHEATKRLKENLDRLGFDGIAISDLFGSWTETRLKQYQEYYGLKANGIADEVNLEKMEEIVNSPFQLNREHPDVIPLKEKLNRLDFGSIKVTQLYGEFTEKKVREFQ